MKLRQTLGYIIHGHKRNEELLQGTKI